MELSKCQELLELLGVISKKIKYPSLYLALVETLIKLEYHYGFGKLQYFLEYCGMDEEETEVVGAFISGPIITSFTATCTCDGKVNIE